MRKFYILFFIISMIIFCGQAFAEENWEQLFNKQIKAWINELSQNDPLFSSWSKSTYTTEALGPNSKQWLVTLFIKDRRVGYMIIAEQEEKPHRFLLMEYGVDEISLFEPKLIEAYYPEISRMAKEIAKIYRGLASHFLIKTEDQEIAVDAKTGEVIPNEFYHKQNEGISRLGSLQPIHLKESYSKPLSDLSEAFPIEAITKKTAALKNLSQIKTHNAYLSTTTWDGKIRLLLPIAGWHQWNDEITYIAVEQEGYRFLPVVKIKQTDGSDPSVCMEEIIVVESDSEVVLAPLPPSSLPH